MSTMPHDSQEAANTDRPATVLQVMEHHIDGTVREFEAVAASLDAPKPASEELLKLTYQVAALTAELFRGEIGVEINIDPEIKGDVCLLFQVSARGDVDEIVALDEQWHWRVLSVAPRWPGLFSLSIDAR